MITWDEAASLRPTQKVYQVANDVFSLAVIKTYYVISVGENGIFLHNEDTPTFTLFINREREEQRVQLGRINQVHQPVLKNFYVDEAKAKDVYRRRTEENEAEYRTNKLKAMKSS